MSPATFSSILSNTSDAVNLSTVDPRDFRDYDRWFRFMVRCLHSGVGREDFIAWSTSDPTYAEVATAIGRRWDSLEWRR